MKILMLNYEFPPLGGGASPVSFDLAKYLVKGGCDVDVVTMRYKGFKKYEVIEGINIYRVSCLRKKIEVCQTYEMATYLFSAFFTIRKLLKRKKYDLIHSHFIIPTGVLAYIFNKTQKIPYVITSHGSDIPNYNKDRFYNIHIFIKPFWKSIVKNASAIITSSLFLSQLISSQVKKSVEIIHHNVESELYKSKKKKNQILIVTRLFKRKGIQYFLEAIKKTKLNMGIIIAGDGPYLYELQNLAKENVNQINFCGFIKGEKLLQLYKESLIFIFLSSEENYPVVLLEALSADCAIITSNTPGCCEVVKDAALIVDPKNLDEIRTAINNLIKNPKLIKNLRKKAKKRISSLTWESVAAKHIRVYKDIINKN